MRAAAANPGLLVVVDLHAHGIPSRILRRLLGSGVFDRTGIAGVPWLVLAPPGDGGDRSWCRGSEVLEPGQVVDPGVQEALTAEVVRISDVLEPAFGSPDSGLSAGMVNRDSIRMWVHELMYREGAIVSACARVGAGRVLILSSSASRIRWFSAGLAERGIPARGRGLPDWLWQRRPRRPEVPTWSGSDLPRADVLLVAESVPMAQSLAAVAEALPAPVRAAALGLTYLGSAAKLGSGSIRQINLTGTSGGTRRKARPMPALLGVPGDEAGKLPPAGIPGVIRCSFEALRARLVTQWLPGQQEWARHVQDVLRQVRPRLLVVGNDRCWSGQIYTRLARSERIETMVVQDGIAAQHDPTWKYSTADHVLAGGTLWPRLLRAEAPSPRKVAVVGQPRYDGLSQRFLARRAGAARLPAGQGNRVLLVLQDIHAPDYAGAVLGEILRVADVEVLVRAHPAFRPAGLDRLSGPRVRFSSGGNIVDDLAWADVVITEYSTVAVEALALDLPVLSVTLSGRPPLLDFTVPGQAEGVAERSQIVAALRRLLGANAPPDPSPARQALLDDLIGPLDDRSAARVAGLVEQILGSGAP